MALFVYLKGNDLILTIRMATFGILLQLLNYVFIQYDIF